MANPGEQLARGRAWVQKASVEWCGRNAGMGLSDYNRNNLVARRSSDQAFRYRSDTMNKQKATKEQRRGGCQ
jgi:hypothetical protein